MRVLSFFFQKFILLPIAAPLQKPAQLPNKQTNQPKKQKNNKQSNASLYNHPFPLLLFDFAYCRCYNM